MITDLDLFTLQKLNEPVSLVCHFFGKQSMAMVGNLLFFRDKKDNELMINFFSGGVATIFALSDIKGIEKFTTEGKEQTLVRLKSPADYLSEK